MKKYWLSRVKASTQDLQTYDVHNTASHESMYESMRLALDTTEVGLARVANIVQNMSISKQGFYGNKQSGDINHCINLANNTLAKKLSPKVTVTLVQNQLPLVFIDTYKITQLLLNLLTNAVAAVNGNGEIVVCSSQHAGQIVVTVSDNGCGIDAHLQDKIFNPRYTTSRNTVGAGLGLAMSQDIAKEHAGRLTVSSQKSEGSIFTLSLPMCDIIIH